MKLFIIILMLALAAGTYMPQDDDISLFDPFLMHKCELLKDLTYTRWWWGERDLTGLFMKCHRLEVLLS